MHTTAPAAATPPQVATPSTTTPRATPNGPLVARSRPTTLAPGQVGSDWVARAITPHDDRAETEGILLIDPELDLVFQRSAHGTRGGWKLGAKALG
jgi:hypothetical protein